MNLKLGVIGAGNMATAIIKGALEKGLLSARSINIYDAYPEKTQNMCEEYGTIPCQFLNEVIQRSDVTLLSVKPNVAKDVLAQISVPNTALLSIVTGLDYETFRANTHVPLRMLRIMPNTPLMVGRGTSAFAMPCTLKDEELVFAETLFSSLGDVVKLPEPLFAAVTGISGSGPAYVYMFIEALADAGVKHGLSRTVALELAANTVAGGAEMVIRTGSHPAVLKDAVCSPGGTTIEAVASFEETGFRSSVIKAVDACVEKAKQL